MIDYFALLDLERRPAIDEESLKKTYFHRTELLRLDGSDADASSSLNMAFRIISNPAMRIQHLLTLAFGDARGGRIKSDLGDLFSSVVETLQKVDQEFGSLSAESSALVRALTFQRMGEAREKLEQTESELLQRELSLRSEIGPLDEVWREDPARSRESLAQVALSLTFVQKWLSEVRERKIRLAELA